MGVKLDPKFWPELLKRSGQEGWSRDVFLTFGKGLILTFGKGLIKVGSLYKGRVFINQNLILLLKFTLFTQFHLFLVSLRIFFVVRARWSLEFVVASRRKKGGAEISAASCCVA